MRKALLLGAALTLAAAGVAYAAITNTYVIYTSFTPAKSGTKTHPVPGGAKLRFVVSTNPTGNRPLPLEKVKAVIAGIQENTSDFPICASSRLLAAGEGPSTCMKGSKVGSGYTLIEYGASADQSAAHSAVCALQSDLYNSGHHDLVLYIYRGASEAGKPACPLPTNPVAVNVTLSKTSGGLAATYSIPANLRHPAANTDAVPVEQILNIPLDKTTIKVKGKKKTVGLFESIACPKNHQRLATVSFTDESGATRKATRGTICK